MGFVNMVPGLALNCWLGEDDVAMYYDACCGKVNVINCDGCSVVVSGFACSGCGAPTSIPDFIGQTYIDLCTNGAYKAFATIEGGRNKFL